MRLECLTSRALVKLRHKIYLMGLQGTCCSMILPAMTSTWSSEDLTERAKVDLASMILVMLYFHSVESMHLWLQIDLIITLKENEIAHVSSTQTLGENSKLFGEHSFELNETWKHCA